MSVPDFTADAAFAHVYEELRRLAHALFARESAQTLQATALVNEAYLRLRTCGDETAGGPVRFRRNAAVAMRRILIEHARGRGRAKRGGGRLPTSLDSVELCTSGDFDQVLAVDEAIDCLAAESPDLAEVVRLRFCAGLDIAEVAQTIDRSERSIKHDWAFAKARLFQLLGESVGLHEDNGGCGKLPVFWPHLRADGAEDRMGAHLVSDLESIHPPRVTQRTIHHRPKHWPVLVEMIMLRQTIGSLNPL